MLVYSRDRSSGDKYLRARSLIQRLSESQQGVVSVQVLQEFYVSLTRKLRPPMSSTEARSGVEQLCSWTVVVPGATHVLEAIDASVRWQISFWDAMLLTAARAANASILWSEDLNHGQNYDGVEVRNPFL